MDAIFKRCSVRTFSKEDVTDDQINDLMKAAMAAPSAGNQQPWEFYITRNDALKQQLSEVSPYAGPAANAPVVIVVCKHLDGLRFAGCIDQDLSAAIENILLEATDFGLGTVWMGIAPAADRVKLTSEAIHAPEGVEPFALIAVGYPDSKPNPRGASRYNPDRVHWI